MGGCLSKPGVGPAPARLSALAAYEQGPPARTTPAAGTSYKDSDAALIASNYSARLSDDEKRLVQAGAEQALGGARKALALINALSVASDSAEAVSQVKRIVKDLLHCDQVTLYVVDSSAQEIRSVVDSSSQPMSVLRVKFGEGLAGCTAMSGGVSNVSHPRSDARFSPTVDARTGYHTRCLLTCAIQDASDRTVAVLQALNKLPGDGEDGPAHFSRCDEDNLAMCSMHLGNYISKCQLRALIDQEKACIPILHGALKSISAAESVDAMVAAMSASMVRLLDADHCAVLLADPARGALWTCEDWMLSSSPPHARPPSAARVRRVPDKPFLQALSAAVAATEGWESSGTASSVLDNNTQASEESPWDVLPPTPLASSLHANRSYSIRRSFSAVPDRETGLRDRTLSSVSSTVGLSAAPCLRVSSVGLLHPAPVAGPPTSRHPGFKAVEAELGRLFDVPLESYVVQPVASGLGGHVTALLIAVNKNRSQASPPVNLFLDSHFSEADTHTLQMLAYEVAPEFAARELDLAFASALSSVAPDGCRLDLRHHSYNASRSLARADGFQVLNAQLADFMTPSQHNRSASRLLDAVCAQGVSQLGRPSRAATASAADIPAVQAQGVLNIAVGGIDADLPDLNTFALDFNPLSTTQQVACVKVMFVELDLVEHHGLNLSTLHNFLTAVSTHYDPVVPYHNFEHVVFVTHCVYYFLQHTKLNHLLSHDDKLALMTAAICHDIDHDGRTNNFHLAVHSQLAVRYNDISVLENHHCAITFALLAKPECGLFLHLPDALQQRLRRDIIKLILSTDMEHHTNLIGELEQHGLEYGAELEADRWLLMRALLHTADLSNPVRPFDVTQRQSRQIHSEFQGQVRAEQARGLPVAPHMNAETEAKQIEVELNFLDYIVAPLWKCMGEVCAPDADDLLATLSANREVWLARDAEMQPVQHGHLRESQGSQVRMPSRMQSSALSPKQLKNPIDALSNQREHQPWEDSP